MILYRNFVLATRVRTALALEPTTANVELETESEGGCVIIKGRLSSVEQLESVRRVAQLSLGSEK